jgi:hypothetical protein
MKMTRWRRPGGAVPAGGITFTVVVLQPAGAALVRQGTVVPQGGITFSTAALQLEPHVMPAGGMTFSAPQYR